MANTSTGGIFIKSDETGIKQLNTMAENVDNGVNNIISTVNSMNDEIDQYPALGPHKEEINRLIDSIKDEIDAASAPAKQVAEKLREKAEELDVWVHGGLGN